MSKFNSIGISSIVALHPKVEIHKFFGLFERVSYQPTHSAIVSYRNFYGLQEAQVFLQIAETEDPTSCLKNAEEMQTVEDGDYCLDLCMSKDCQFAAFQVFERKKGEYIPYSKLRFLEGDSARIFENLLA